MRVARALGTTLIALSACDDCPNDPAPVFTHDLVDPERILNTLPPWRSDNGEIKGHGNIRVAGSGPSAKIYAPADMQLVVVAASTNPAEANIGGANGPSSILALFRVSCEVTLRIDHIHHPAPKLLEALGGAETEVRWREVDVRWRAGEEIGSAEDDGHGHANFDFGLTNSALPALRFVNQGRYEDSKTDAKLAADCPYRYFAPELRDHYTTHYSDEDGTSAPGYTCARDAQDVADTLSGAWFPESDPSTGYGVDHLAIAVQPSGKKFKLSGFIEAYVPIGAGVPAPNNVMDEVCYTIGAGYAYLRLVTPVRLQVVYHPSPAACPSTFAAATGTMRELVR